MFCFVESSLLYIWRSSLTHCINSLTEMSKFCCETLYVARNFVISACVTSHSHKLLMTSVHIVPGTRSGSRFESKVLRWLSNVINCLSKLEVSNESYLKPFQLLLNGFIMLQSVLEKVILRADIVFFLWSVELLDKPATTHSSLKIVSSISISMTYNLDLKIYRTLK